MTRPGFLDTAWRQGLIERARDGSAAHRLARRADALALRDDAMSCAAVAKVLLLDDDIIRTWHRLHQEDSIEGVASFAEEGSACRLGAAQQERLEVRLSVALPRTTRAVGAWIEQGCGMDNARCHHARPVQAWLAAPADQAALHLGLLHAPQPGRTALGIDAQARRPQPVPRTVR